tara:strand:+ start:307 stop:573 length:267 start_codon:yes stop_codon:yes gene_type:complete
MKQTLKQFLEAAGLNDAQFAKLLKKKGMKTPGSSGLKVEKTLTEPEEDEKERVVKGMKKDKRGFKDRYGSDWKSVMYATATKVAKKNA